MPPRRWRPCGHPRRPEVSFGHLQRVSPRSRLDRASAFSIVFNCSGSSRWPSASKCSKFGYAAMGASTVPAPPGAWPIASFNAPRKPASIALCSPISLVNRSRLRVSQKSPSSLTVAQNAEPLGLVQERNHAQVAAQEIGQAAAARVAGVVRFTEGMPRPAFQLRLELPEFGVRNLTGELAQPEVGRFAAVARLRLKGDDVQGPDIHLAGDALAFLRRCHRERDMGACLNQQPAVRIVVGPLLPVALVAPELDNFADVLEGQVERRLPKLLDELAGVRFVARGRQLVMNRQAHVVSLAFMVQRPGQSVTHEMALAAPPPTRRSRCLAEPAGRYSPA